MPKRNQRWSTFEPPETPLQQGAFLDACTAWMVAEPETSHIDTTVNTRCPPSTIDTGCDEVFARTIQQSKDYRDWLCIVCQTRIHHNDAKPHMANPFSQHCMVIVCRKCAALP